MNPVVQKLKANGYEVQCVHLRKLKHSDAFTPQRKAKKADAVSEQGEIDSCGGLTVLTIRDPKGKTYSSVAQCCKQDNFNRARGFEIALTRALDLMAGKTELAFHEH